MQAMKSDAGNAISSCETCVVKAGKCDRSTIKVEAGSSKK